MSHDKRVWGSALTWCLRSVGLRRGAIGRGACRRRGSPVYAAVRE